MDGDLGVDLRRLRLARGLALAEVARRVGVTRLTLRRWESGETPRGEGLVHLLDALKADAGERARIHAEAPLRTAQLDPGIAHGPLESPVHLGQALRALRLQARRSQAELASGLGTTQATIARWETGRNAPETETLSRVLHALRTTEEEAKWVRGLVDREPSGFGSPEEASAWLRDNRPSLTHPGEARMLAVENEAWRRAARDEAWEPFLVEARSWRSIAHQYACNEQTAWETSESAKRLAARSGAWSEASVACGIFHSDPQGSYRSSIAGLREFLERPITAEARLFALQELAHVYRFFAVRNRATGHRDSAFRKAESLYLRIVQEAEIDYDPVYNRTVSRADGWVGLTTLYADYGEYEEAIEAYGRILTCGAPDFVRDSEALQDYVISAHLTGTRPMAGTLETVQRQGLTLSRIERHNWERCVRIIELPPLPHSLER